MKFNAALLIETGKPLQIEQIQMPVLKPGQVIVEIHYSGVCHTQVLEARGYKGKDPYCPHCMGHEGTGIVVEIGPEVTKVKPGDKVVMSWIKGNGLDVPGTVYSGADGRNINAGGVTTFSEYSVVSENRLTLLPDQLQLIDGTMIGCAVATGMGSVFNTGNAQTGQSIAVFGAGGIGLCAIAAAKIANAENIIAIDINDSKLEVAKSMGATHTIKSTTDIVEKIKEIKKQGVDLAIEATGRPIVMTSAVESVRNQGGIAVIVGNAHFDEKLTIDPKQLNMGKQIRGTWGGDSVPDRDFPKYSSYLIDKKFSLQPLQSKNYKLEQINQALDDLECGNTVRPIISMK
jgi:S-(hydroxymethyl)glutathione dehydrogenase/alcohol dehydrogenase